MRNDDQSAGSSATWVRQCRRFSGSSSAKLSSITTRSALKERPRHEEAAALAVRELPAGLADESATSLAGMRSSRVAQPELAAECLRELEVGGAGGQRAAHEQIEGQGSR